MDRATCPGCPLNSQAVSAKKASVCRVTSAWSRNMWPHQPPLGRTFSLSLVGSVYAPAARRRATKASAHARGTCAHRESTLGHRRWPPRPRPPPRPHLAPQGAQRAASSLLASRGPRQTAAWVPDLRWRAGRVVGLAGDSHGAARADPPRRIGIASRWGAPRRPERVWCGGGQRS